MAKLAKAVDHLTKTFLDHPGIPSEEVTLTHFDCWGNADARFSQDEVRGSLTDRGMAEARLTSQPVSQSSRSRMPRRNA